LSLNITKDGLETAISNLQYRNPKLPKTRLIEAIRSFYQVENALETVSRIDSDSLIRMVWELEDNPVQIKSKRKNLNSIKSTINNDLLQLFHENKNPEGIIIGPLNTFIMSDAAKEKLLSSFADSARFQGDLPLDKVADVLSVISEFISEITKIGAVEIEKDSAVNPRDQVKKILDLIKGMAEKASLEDVNKDTKDNEIFTDSDGNDKISNGTGSLTTDKDSDQKNLFSGQDKTFQSGLSIDEVEDTAIEEIDEDAAIEEADDADLEQIDEDEIKEVEDTAIEEIDDDTTIEEADDADLEEIDEDEIEEVEDTAIEEIDEDAAIEEADDTDLEEIDEDEIEEVEDTAIEEIDDDTTIEEADDADLEEIDEDEIEEVEDTAIEEIDEDTAIEEADDTDLEEIDEDEIEEIEDTAIEEIDEDAAIEEADDADLEEIDEDEIEEVEDTAIEEIDDDTTIEEADDTDLEEIDEDEIEEVEDTAIEEIDDDTTIEEADDTDLEEIDEDEIEEVEDTAIEEIDDDTTIEEADDTDLEEIDEDEIEEVEDTAIEEIDEDTAIEEVDDADLEEIDEDETIGKTSIFDQLGLPQDNLEQKSFQPDTNLLTEQFDGFLGSMERYYNQYLLIPGGQYKIGSRSADIDLPEKLISLPDFYIGKYPVTNALFEVFVERTGYQTTAEKLGHGWVYSGRFQKKIDSKTKTRSFEWRSSYAKEKIKGAFWYQPSGPGSTLHGKRNHPVVQVSVQDAVHFSAWIGKRLCTESEWEAAARTQRGYLYPWGNEWMENACNYENSSISDTTPVDKYSGGVNSLGVADTLCNVLEWTSDQIKPASGKIREKIYHIAKGGSWISARNIQLSNRFRFEADYTANILGFRCVAD
jgi:formylglycine-generating enzyme required for sulfatase activity